MWHYQMVVADTKHLTKSLAVAEDIALTVATIAVNIKCSIVTFATASMACAAKGHHASSHVVIIQLRLLHGAKLRILSELFCKKALKN
jgi:hypothetical protein